MKPARLALPAAVVWLSLGSAAPGQLLTPPTPATPPAPGPATAPAPAQPVSTPPPGARQWAVNRQDLAFAYMMLERELRQRPPTGADVARVNKAFDAATMRFFRLDLAGAVRQIHELMMERRGESAPAAADGTAPAKPADYARRFLWSLKVEVLPNVWVNGASRNINTGVGMVYVPSRTGVPPEQLKVRFAVEVEGNPGVAGLRHEFTFDGTKEGDPWRQVKLTAHNNPVPRLKPGRWRVRLVPIDPPPSPGLPDGGVIEAGYFTVVDESPIKVKQEIDDRIAALRRAADGLPPDDPRGGIEFRLAFETAQSRASLLNEAMVPTKPAEFLLDQPALIAALRHELAELEAGRNPYKSLAGDHWRAFSTPDGPMAARVYAPAGKPGPDGKPAGDAGPRPLVIALHGAGGDEAMFAEGYGDGEIKRLADEMGFIVVAPRTEMLIRNDQNIDRLVSALMQDYSIDLRRVYALGHSMGAMTAARLAQSRGDTLAAVACLAGGPRGAGRAAPAGEPERSAPMLVIAAELDPIVTPAGLKSGAESARRGGGPAAERPVEFRLAKDMGHTLMVGPNLRPALEWLFTHTRPEGNR